MIDLCDLFPISGLFIDFHIWIELIVNAELALLFMHQSENELHEVRILKIDIASLMEIHNGVVSRICACVNNFQKAPPRTVVRVIRCSNIYLCLSGRSES